MKIKLLCLALLCFSQTFAQVTNPLDSQMVALTQNLDFTEVTSGILFDRGVQTARPAGYDGSSNADTVFSFDDWWLQYAAMYTGNVNATKLSLAGVCLLLTLITFGQTVPFPTHTVNDNTVPFPEKMDDVFGNLDLTDVTTNLLLDRAWPFAKPAAFDGSQGADTVKSHKHWLKLYGTIATAAISQSAPIPSINDWRAQRDAEEENGKNPLVIIHADYHRIKRDSALIYSLFYEQNGELYDAPNQSTSPYEAQTLFAFSPYKTTIYDSLSMDL